MSARGLLLESATRATMVAAATGALALAFYLTLGQALFLAGVAGGFAGAIRYLSGRRTGR